MLILIDNPQQSVMHYIADDTSADAIKAEIKRAGYGNAAWREITAPEYAAIRAARPKPAIPPSATPANVDLAQLMLELSEQVADTRRQIRELAATEVVRQVDVREIK